MLDHYNIANKLPALDQIYVETDLSIRNPLSDIAGKPSTYCKFEICHCFDALKPYICF